MDTILSKCKESVFSLNKLSENDINSLLLKIKDGLINNKDFILEENKKDLEAAKNIIKPQMMDRLALNDKRIQGLCDSIDTLVKLPNYIGEVIEEITAL